jgi:hypothetical protein
MAAPSYTEDLTDLSTAENTTGWAEFTGNSYNRQGSPAGGDPDYPFIQGSYAVTQDCTKDGGIGSLGYNAGGGITIPTDGAVLVWSNFSSAGNIETYANGGFRVVIGNSLSDFRAWYVGGVDKGTYPYGGWQCHAANPTVTPDDTAGTPTTTYQYIGAAVSVITGPKKGETHQVDVLRYGRCSAIFTLGELADPANIAGFAVQNDNINNRWGLIQDTNGGYLWQGRMQLGTSGTAVYFEDINKNIFINFTPKVTSNFNLIEINNTGSYISMTGFTFQVLDTDTASRGTLLMNDQADVYLDQCTFIDMNTFTFDASGSNTVEITDCVFRRCSGVYQGSATFDGCLFSNFDTSSSMFADNIDEITNCSFVSDGSNHAIELDSNHAGGTFTLTGCTYDNYATSNGSTGNEPIYNNSGGHVTINVVGGDTPYYRNGSGATTTIVQTINWYFKIVDSAGDIVNTAEFRIYDSNLNQLFGVETSDGTELYQFDAAISGTTAIVRVHDLNYLHNSQTLSHPSTSNTAAAPTTIVLAVDRVYDNPT